MAGGTWDAILSALGGASLGLGRGLEMKHQRDRELALDEDRKRENASQNERRDYENLATVAALADRGIKPVGEIQDRTDFSPTMGAMASIAGGQGIGLPPAQTPNPAHYQAAGAAGGRQYFYNPDDTKEARTLQQKEAARVAEVARLLGMKKPDGSMITRPEAEAIVDKNLSSSDVFREHNIDRLSGEGIRAEKQLEAYRSNLTLGREQAMAGVRAKQEKPLQDEKLTSDAADRFIALAGSQLGEKATQQQLVQRAVAAMDWAKRTGELKPGDHEPTAAHLGASAQRFTDRFTAKSKQADQSPFEFLAQGAPGGAAPAAPAPASHAGGSLPVAPDSTVIALSKKHRGDIKKVKAELAELGFDPNK